jgi:hypothetical protein
VQEEEEIDSRVLLWPSHAGGVARLYAALCWNIAPPFSFHQDALITDPKLRIPEKSMCKQCSTSRLQPFE